MMVEPIAEADECELLVSPIAPFHRGNAGSVEERELDIFERGGAGEEIEVLEDEAEAAIANEGALIGSESGDLFAREHVAAAGRPIKAAEGVHEGALARAGGAHEREKLPCFDIEADLAQRMDSDFSEVVGLGDIAELNEGHRKSRSDG